MKTKLAISALAACMIMTTPALAGDKKGKNDKRDQASSQSVAVGGTAAGRDGAVAVGGAGSRAEQRAMRRNNRTACVPGSVATTSNQSVYTDRRTGSAASSTSGTASGSGTVRSSSTGDVYSSTDQNGSTADAYGESTAVAREPTRRC